MAESIGGAAAIALYLSSRWGATKPYGSRGTNLITCWICIGSVILLTALERSGFITHLLVPVNGRESLESGHIACLQRPGGMGSCRLGQGWHAFLQSPGKWAGFPCHDKVVKMAMQKP